MINKLRLVFSGAMVLALTSGLAGVAFAQSFQVAETSVSVKGIPDNFVEPYSMLTNLTSSPLKVAVKIVENSLPQDWSVTICLVNCFAPGVTDVVDEMDANDSKPLKLTIMTGVEPAIGSITLAVSNNANPMESTNVTFHVNTTAVSVNDLASPKQLVLTQNYPNPVSLGGSAVTTISYGVPRAAQVTLKVYNLLGKEIRTLVNEQRSQGLHSTLWDGRDVNGNLVPPGVYVYKLSNGKSTQTRRMLIAR